jgi:hypothetical protein
MLRLGWVGQEGVASPRPPQGLPHGIPRAELDDARIGFLEGCPRDAVWSGWRQVDETPHSPSVEIISDPAALGGAWGRNTCPSIRCLAAADSQSEHATEGPPHLHQLVHQRLRTTMDALGREPKDQARPRTNCRYSRSAACDYGTEGLHRLHRYVMSTIPDGSHARRWRPASYPQLT